MAYVNVKDWSVDQVVDWLKGLDNVILQHKHDEAFLKSGVTGHQLLNLRADDLEHLGVKALGHQELILEAVEHLRNFHFELDQENLQMLALRLSCASNSLYKELLLVDDDCTRLKPQSLSDVHNIINTIKPLVCWLDRAPFGGKKDYLDTKTSLLQLAFEMATSAHRGIFSDQPVRTIRRICEELSKIADHIIQDILDPMILQPASLDLATLKKKEQELGFFILPSNYNIHQIADIKFGSPAHSSSKIEEGDEIVQVNYQTVVGWQRKKVMMLLQESPPEIVLTLKKRPRHSKVYGQIYMKPYRLPSRKRGDENWSRWNDSLPSPRLLPILDLPPIADIRAQESKAVTDEEAELSSSDSDPPDSPLDGSCRMYPLKPRPILQRRNTITGATPTNKRPYPSIEEYWDFIKPRTNTATSSAYNIDDNTKFDEEESRFLRDKSASCNIGLDLSPRPTTVIGLAQQSATKNNPNKKSFRDKEKSSSTKKKVNFEEDKKDKELNLTVETNLNDEKSVSINSLSSLNNENISYIDEGRDLTDRTSMAADWQKEIVEEIIDTIKPKVTEPLIEKEMPGDPVLLENKVNVHAMIKKFAEQNNDSALPRPKVFPRNHVKKAPEIPQKPPEVPQKPDPNKKPQVPPRSATTKLRGRLDKSHSTPAYDLTEDDTTITVEKPEKSPEPIEKLPDVIPKIPETIKEHSPIKKETPDCMPFIETSLGMGIPVAEAINLPLITKKVEEIKNCEIITKSEIIIKKSEVIITKKEVDSENGIPPKPPPRIFVETPKPAYPTDSPKPNLILKQVFEFPETKSVISHSRQSSEELDSEHYLIPKDMKFEHFEHFEEKGLPPKGFEPRNVSTPVTKGIGVFSEGDYKCFEMPKEKENKEVKVSPTNSIVKAMISSKGKSGKKKGSIAAKRRKVLVSELTPASIQGYLFQRLRDKHNQNVRWEKRWFVLFANSLYGYKNVDDSRAACLIFLSGFTVAIANEVKSRSNAFKVYHTGTVFYFSAENPDVLQSWIDLIKTACLHNDNNKNTDGSLYSESDDSDSEKSKNSSEKGDSLKKFGSLKKFSSKKSEISHGSTSLDRKWFFSMSGSHSKNSLPVPTAQFRSYRKIRTPNSSTSSVTTGNFTSHVPFYAPTPNVNASVPNLTENIKKSKVKPINYVHASNPSLCNISEYNGASFPPKGNVKRENENLAGFVTLEQLMIKQSEERKLNPHNVVEEMQLNLKMIKPDVVYGEIPIRPIHLSTPSDTEETSKILSRSTSTPEKNDTSSCFGKRLGSLKKNHSKDSEFDDGKTATYPKSTKFEHKANRSLPRTHKTSEYKACYASDRNLFKERSYEMIYCPETVNDVQFAQNRTLDDTMYHDSPKKLTKLKKQRSFAEKKTSKVADSSTTKVKLKSATQYTPIALPLAQDSKSKPKFAFELNLDEKDKQSKGGKLKQMFGGKGEKKEKTFLGSPKLHRAIFRKHSSGNDLSWQSSPPSQSSSMSQSMYSLEAPTRVATPEVYPLNMEIRPHADYPGLEYPPVFEPETYSFANPQTSLSLLRKNYGIDSKDKSEEEDGEKQ